MKYNVYFIDDGKFSNSLKSPIVIVIHFKMFFMANLIIKNITKVDFLFGTFEDDFFC